MKLLVSGLSYLGVIQSDLPLKCKPNNTICKFTSSKLKWRNSYFLISFKKGVCCLSWFFVVRLVLNPSWNKATPEINICWNFLTLSCFLSFFGMVENISVLAIFCLLYLTVGPAADPISRDSEPLEPARRPALEFGLPNFVSYIGSSKCQLVSFALAHC